MKTRDELLAQLRYLLAIEKAKAASYDKALSYAVSLAERDVAFFRYCENMPEGMSVYDQLGVKLP